MLVTAVTVLSDDMATTDVMKIVVPLEVMFAIISNRGGMYSPWRFLAALRIIFIGQA